MDSGTVSFVRIALLLFKGGMLVLRGVFDREVSDGVPLQLMLQSHEGRLKKCMIRPQYRILYPTNGTPDPDDFDLSVLIAVLTNVLLTDEDEKKEVQYIKDIREKVIHEYSHRASLDEGTFTYMSQVLTEALKNLSANVSADLQKDCEDLITKFLNDPLTEKTAVDYIKDIKNEDERLLKVHEMLEDQMKAVKVMVKESEERLTKTFDKKIEDKIGEQGKLFTAMIASVKGNQVQSDRESTDDTQWVEVFKCERCFEKGSNSVADYYCKDCNKAICSGCNDDMHVKCLSLSMKNHHIKYVNALISLKVDMNVMDLCDQHSLPVEDFCRDHQKLSCKHCKRFHEGCSCEGIEKVAKSSANEMLDPVAKIDRLNYEANEMYNWTRNLPEKINNDLQQLSVQIKEKKQEMNILFDQKTGEMLNEATDFRDKKVEQIEGNSSQCKDLVDYTSRTKQSILQIATRGTASQKFIANHYLSSKVKAYESDFKRVKDMYTDSQEFNVYRIFEEIAEEIAPLSLNASK